MLVCILHGIYAVQIYWHTFSLINSYFNPVIAKIAKSCDTHTIEIWAYNALIWLIACQALRIQSLVMMGSEAISPSRDSYCEIYNFYGSLPAFVRFFNC